MFGMPTCVLLFSFSMLRSGTTIRGVLSVSVLSTSPVVILTLSGLLLFVKECAS